MNSKNSYFSIVIRMVSGAHLWNILAWISMKKDNDSVIIKYISSLG